MKIKKQYYYHLSDTLYETEIKIFPRENGANRSVDEPKVKRICVAPSINRCILALNYDFFNKYNVYKTKNKVIGKLPFNVSDAKYTKERWLIKPIKFIKIGKVDLENFIMPSPSACNYKNTILIKSNWNKIRKKNFLNKYDNPFCSKL